MKQLKNNNGYATLIALIMVGMLTLIGVASLSTSDDEVKIAGNSLQEIRAFYASEAGLEQAAAEIQAIFDSTGLTPTDLPSGDYELNGCVVAYATTDNGPPTQQTLSSGTLSGLHALVKSFSLRSIAINRAYNAQVSLAVDFKAALVPIFQFAVFYNNDLEIAPGPQMTLIGRVHSNGNMYLQSNNSLRVDSYVTAAGDIFHGRKGPGGTGSGDVLIKDAQGSYANMKEGSNWLDASNPDWYDLSATRWSGRVQDASFGQGGLNLPLNGAGTDAHAIIEPGNSDSYENKATLKFIDGQAYQKVGASWVDVTPEMISKGIIEFNNNQFTDLREGELVDVMELNIDKLYSEGYQPSNGVIYFYDEEIGGSWPALRLNNASELQAPLTIASGNPIYTNGDFNSVNKKPAAIMADAVTHLSNSWNDANSNLNKNSRIASETTVNASIITGNVETTSSVYSGGLENLPRFLEKWSNKAFNWKGSMVNLWVSHQSDGQWNGTYYSPPIRNWLYDTDLDDPANLPPETPQVRVFQRTGWKQDDIARAS